MAWCWVDRQRWGKDVFDALGWKTLDLLQLRPSMQEERSSNVSNTGHGRAIKFSNSEDPWTINTKLVNHKLPTQPERLACLLASNHQLPKVHDVWVSRSVSSNVNKYTCTTNHFLRFSLHGFPVFASLSKPELDKGTVTWLNWFASWSLSCCMLLIIWSVFSVMLKSKTH